MPSPVVISPARSAFRIALVYLVLAGAWIILSDNAAFRLFEEGAPLRRASEYKGLFFVAVTSLLLFAGLKSHFDSIARSQDALARSEKLFADFMNNLPVAAFLRDAAGHYIYANPYWEMHFSGGLEWRGATPASFFPSNIVRLADEDHRRVLSGARVVERTLHVQADGREATWLVRRFPVQTAPGGPLLVGAFGIDVTEIRLIEEQLRQAAKMEALGRLAGGIAHDFNNLLTVIIGQAQLLELTPGLPARAAGSAAEIAKAGERGARLTQQLLAFSRKKLIEAAPLDLNQIVNDSRSVLAGFLGADIQLAVNLAPELAPVLADRAQLEQVLLNLVINARDASSAGGAITVSTAPADLDPPAFARLGLQPGAYVQLTVSDTGHGMDAATRARIFEPFFTTKDRDKGTGLGLSTVYAIVLRSGGAITVDSEPNRGSTFTVYLPQAV